MGKIMRSRFLPVNRNRGQESAQVTDLLTMNDLILISSVLLVTTLIFWGADDQTLYYAYGFISAPVSLVVIAKNKWLHKRQLEDFLSVKLKLYKSDLEIKENEK